MATLRDELLPVMHDVRGILGDLGFRTTSLSILTRTWVGDRPGYPDPSAYTDTALTISPRPRIRFVSAREIAQSGGLFSQDDVRADKITPAFAGGGYTQEQLQPHTGRASNIEVVYRLTGAIVGDYALVTASFDRALGYSLILTRTTRTP